MEEELVKLRKKLEEVKRQVLEEQHLREEAERRRLEEQQLREEAELRRLEEQQLREKAQHEVRNTTLVEYLQYCHQHLFTTFDVQRDPKLTTTGPASTPHGKLCPTYLRHWNDFDTLQRRTLDCLFSLYPADQEAFPSLHATQTQGQEMPRGKIGDHLALDHFVRNFVETPVRSIFARLMRHDRTRDEFGIVGQVHFHHRDTTLPDDNVEQVARPPPGPATPPPAFFKSRVQPDRICCYQPESAERPTNLYHIGYKLAHKIVPDAFRLGLHDMNIIDDVVNRKTIPASGSGERSIYDAEQLTAAAFAQTFDHMVRGGLSYGLLTTGEILVFIKVDWTNPTTAYYYVVELDKETQVHLDADKVIYWSAVSQVLAFTLAALKQPSPSQSQLDYANKNLKRWVVTFDSVYSDIKSNWGETPASEWFSKSPLLSKKRKGRNLSPCPTDLPNRRRSPSRDSSGGGAAGPNSAPTRRSRRIGLQQSSRVGDTSSASHPPNQGAADNQKRMPYCTQRCLLRLVKGGLLDQACPNFELHRRAHDVGNGHHPISHFEWLQLLRTQLHKTLDDGIVPAGIVGACGVIFHVTLLGYGYTFIAKGTVDTLVHKLEHEADVYKQLAPLQGVYIPVFLGAVDLRTLDRTYYYDLNVDIVHLTFLSWAGEPLYKPIASDVFRKANVGQEVARSVRALHQMGVAHTDVRAPNMLWNEENRRVMMIDFERAVLGSPARRSLLPKSPKRHRGLPPKGRQSAETEFDRKVQSDLWAIRGML
ncbi:hypothetical protein QBC40DRAFT_291318 [Triangularia verruculosa]|uniref:Protein kinase domain-containing protein n=1 Tax=Triangularia verruculosa TaxID=2587418 RepID=A0AAN6X6W9_9PEZI|nr:hypothetical protein QBC40DRAFT_291318 [Triangularia verruculosa]